jgi:hypothetical protein
VNNEPHPDAHALWIKFAGREWIIMHHTEHFQAIPADNRRVKKSDIQKLFRYLVNEGFINDDGYPPQTNQQPANV